MMKVALTLTEAEVSILIDALELELEVTQFDLVDFTDVTLMEYYLTRAVMLRKLREIHND